MSAAIFFSIVTVHEYFDNRKCPDIFIEPTPACKIMLQKNGLLYRRSPDGAIAVIAVNNNMADAVKNAADSLTFSFYIFLNNPLFETFTQLPEKQPETVFYFTNKTKDNPASGTLYQGFLQKPLQQPDPAGKLFGIIAVYADSSFPRQLDLHFDAAAITWKYYVLVNGKLKHVKVDGSLADVTFANESVETDPVAAAITGSFPGVQPVLFTSGKQVPYREMGRKNIRLINQDNLQVLVQHLPNPGFKDNGVMIINTSG